MSMVTHERANELHDLFWNETNDSDTEEWRESLTQEEAAIVARWDRQVEVGLGKLYKAITDLNNHSSRPA